MEEAQSYTFEEFSMEMGDFEVKKVSEFDRMWKVEPGGSVLQMLVLHDDTLYFGSCNFNYYAVDIRNGSLKWKYKTEGMIGEGSSTYWNGNVFFGSFDYNLYCLDAETGKVKWKYKTEAEANTKPFISNGKVYFGSRDRFLYCLDVETGKLVWKYETQGVIISSPTVHDGKVLFGSFDKNMYCLDAESGQLIWKITTQGEVHNMNPIMVHNGVVFFVSFDNFLRAADVETGRLLWKFPTGQYGNAVIPVLHNDVLYHVSRDGNMFAITLDGKQIWKYVNRHNLCVPIIHEDRIYVGSEDLNLHCFSLEGKKLWSYKVDGPVFVRCAIKDDVIFFPSWDCNVYALGLETRELLWKFTCDGPPAYLPPVYGSFEVVMKIPKTTMKEEGKKKYELDLAVEGEKNASAYKSRVTYQISTQYSEKGKYQVDSDEEEF